MQFENSEGIAMHFTSNVLFSVFQISVIHALSEHPKYKIRYLVDQERRDGARDGRRKGGTTEEESYQKWMSA